MLIRILDNRKVEKQEEEGTQNENRIVTLNLIVVSFNPDRKELLALLFYSYI